MRERGLCKHLHGVPWLDRGKSNTILLSYKVFRVNRDALELLSTLHRSLGSGFLLPPSYIQPEVFLPSICLVQASVPGPSLTEIGSLDPEGEGMVLVGARSHYRLSSHITAICVEVSHAVITFFILETAQKPQCHCLFMPYTQISQDSVDVITTDPA